MLRCQALVDDDYIMVCPQANLRALTQESYTIGTLLSLFYSKGNRGRDKSKTVKKWSWDMDSRTHTLKLHFLPGYENICRNVYFRMTTLRDSVGLANQKPFSTPLFSYVPPTVDKTKYLLSQTLLQLRWAVWCFGHWDIRRTLLGDFCESDFAFWWKGQVERRSHWCQPLTLIPSLTWMWFLKL